MKIETQMEVKLEMKKLFFAVSKVMILAFMIMVYCFWGNMWRALEVRTNPGSNNKNEFLTDYEIIVSPMGQLGNQMFQYASLLGIAKANGRNCRFVSGRLDSVFNVTHSVTNSSILNQTCYGATEHKNRYYDERLHKGLTSMVYQNGTNKCVIIDAHLEVWKYFKDIENEIRSEFKFKEAINAEVNNFLERYKDYTLVGVHVRLGDMLQQQENSYQKRIPKYLTKADALYTKRYKNILYVVCSNDIKLSKTLVPFKNVVFSENRTAEVDLAILASCDHVIRTAGTYGWWAAWLANGTTTYMRTAVYGPDYEYPTWIPLEDKPVQAGYI